MCSRPSAMRHKCLVIAISQEPWTTSPEGEDVSAGWAGRKPSQGRVTLLFSSSCCRVGDQLSTEFSCRILSLSQSSCRVTSSPLHSCREVEPLGRWESLLLVLLCGQRSCTAEDVTVPEAYHPLRVRTALTCCHHSCDSQQECSCAGRAKFPAGRKERTLQAGETMVSLIRSSPGSDATDVPVSIILAFSPSHTSVCRTFMHILGFVFASQKGKRQLAEHSLHLWRTFYPSFLLKASKYPLFHVHLSGLTLAQLLTTAPNMKPDINMKQ